MPLVVVDVIAEADLAIDIVAEEINLRCLILSALIQKSVVKHSINQLKLSRI